MMGEVTVFQPVKKKNEKLVNLVMNNIKDALIKGRFKPGDKLPPIAEMAAEMNVGVSSVREAIKMLEALCVVKTRQGGRTVICTELDDDSINPLTFQLMVLERNSQDMIEFRKMFESAYTFMALENATQDDLDSIRLIVEALCEKTRTQEAEVEDELVFHRAVLHSTHNQYVIKMGEAMLELFLATIQKQLVFDPDYSVSENHFDIYEALRDKDKRKLHAALEKTFQGWKIKFFEGR